MSFIDDQIDDYLMQDALELNEEDDFYDFSGILSEKQRPSTLGGVDWRYEKGGIFCDD